MSIYDLVFWVGNPKKVTRLLCQSMSPICKRAAKATETVALIGERIRVLFVTDAGVGYMYPILHNVIMSAALFTVFKKFTVKRYKFCAGNHFITPITILRLIP